MMRFLEKAALISLTTTGLEGVKHWLKHWIPDMRVIEPKSLANEMVEELEKQICCQKGMVSPITDQKAGNAQQRKESRSSRDSAWHNQEALPPNSRK